MRVVDLAEVNGRVFVNSVSLGVYAEAGGEALGLRWTGVAGRVHRTSAVVLVFNDRYRVGRVLGSGSCPRLDAGVLGVTVLGVGMAGGSGKRFVEWSAFSFEVDFDGPVAVGIDGEALGLDLPLRVGSRPAVLGVWIALQHLGAASSAAMPAGPGDAI